MDALIVAGGSTLGDAKYRGAAGLVALWPALGTEAEQALEAITTANVRDTTEVAYLQQIAPLATEEVFCALCRWVATSDRLWAINLAGVPFSAERIEHFIVALSQSNVTHINLECPELTPCMRARLVLAARENQSKHDWWRTEANPVASKVCGMWVNPRSEPGCSRTRQLHKLNPDQACPPEGGPGLGSYVVLPD
jgi:hypothetical protein